MMTRPIATLSDCRSPVSAVHQVTFDKLAERFGKCDVGTKEGKAWMPADIEVGPRTAERVNSVSLLVLDVEADAEAVKGESGDPLRDKHGDIVKRIIGPEPPAVDDMLAELPLHGWHCILHTSYSHSAEHPRYRLIFDLSRPLAPAEIKFFGLHVAGLIGIGDCFDSACLEPARLFYLPRCPAERLPLFRHGVTEGDPLPVDDLLTEARKIEAAQKSALTRRHGGQSGNVIQAFNDQADIRLMLEQHGYVPKGRRRWLRAGSTTGLPGVRLLPDDGKGERVYSNHGGDPLNDGHAHDAFDCWRILNHGGDMSAAVKEAARLLGMEGVKRATTNPKGAPKGECHPGMDCTPAGDPAPLPTLIRASDVVSRPINWLWPGWIAGGKLHIIGGAPGLAKTTIALAFAATVSAGGRWPDGTRCAEQGDAVIWSGEDGIADTLKPRLEAMGANLERVHFVGGIADAGGDRPFDPASDMRGLLHVLSDLQTVRLVIVDPVVSAVAGDSHKNAEVRRGLQPLVDFGEKLGIAVIGITHFSKGTAGRDPLERLTGSIAFGALARLVFGAAKLKDEDGEEYRAFVRIKSNIGEDGGGFRYDVDYSDVGNGVVGSHILWGESIEGAAREILRDDSNAGDPDEQSAAGEARQFLESLLSDGPMRAGDVQKEGRGAGFSESAIRRAGDKLKVLRHKDGMRGGWVWKLPAKASTSPEDAEDVSLKRLTPTTPSATSSVIEVEI